MGTRRAQPFHSALIKLPAHLFCLPTYRTQHCPVGSEGRSQPRSISRTTTIRRLLSQSSSPSSPAFILMKAADRFANPTTAPNQLWQTDYTYLKVIGWGRFYLSTVLDDFSRYIMAWKLCTTMA